MSKHNEIPRRFILDENTDAEKAIRKAMEEVEKAGADVKLTQVISLLDTARNVLSDYVDSEIAKGK